MSKTKKNPWAWVPSLYFAEGIPYVIVMVVSVIMYKRLGISNTDIALYTSWLYLPCLLRSFAISGRFRKFQTQTGIPGPGHPD